MGKPVRIFVINTGSTSTKLAIFDDEKELFSKSLDHSVEELAAFPHVLDQLEFRKEACNAFIDECCVNPNDFNVIASRGGAFGVFKGGAYLIDGAIIRLASSPRPGFVAQGSWLAAHIAWAMANESGIKAYFYDAVFSDEMDAIAKYSGVSFIERKSAGHPLNSKEVARRVAARMGKDVKDCSFIVCHLGGGITVEMHNKGRFIDCLTFTEGAFTPERAGRVPSNSMVDLCFSGKFASKADMMRFMRGGGGLVDYLGTNSVIEVEQRIDRGDLQAEEVLRAMSYQIAKDIGGIATTVAGKVDRIILSGGIANSKRITSWLKEQVEFIAPVEVMPGSFEMEALAGGILRVYRGDEAYSVYVPQDE